MSDAAVTPGSGPVDGAYAALCAALTETFGVEQHDLRPDATFEELDVDSLALLEFALVMGERLGVSSKDAELRPTMTLAEAAAYVQALRSGAGVPGCAAQGQAAGSPTA
ncbi:acyl carrier protein [Streptomyces sp. NPDC020742]|uniref:acyl carrier protein n=1 Tax=Streptomyces sp. NPDC020742 TaxID=3154897 RepID=UPI0033E3413A